MRALIPSPLWQMNTAVPTPQPSHRLLPSYFICEPGGSCKGGKKWWVGGFFNYVAAAAPLSKNGLNLIWGVVHVASVTLLRLPV